MSDDDLTPHDRKTLRILDRIEEGGSRDYLLSVIVAFLCGFAGACIVGFVLLWGSR